SRLLQILSSATSTLPDRSLCSFRLLFLQSLSSAPASSALLPCPGPRSARFPQGFCSRSAQLGSPALCSTLLSSSLDSTPDLLGSAPQLSLCIHPCLHGLLLARLPILPAIF
ncbi:hypothetical protein ANANG_G00121510, partial [Anguilla anguilla]